MAKPEFDLAELKRRMSGAVGVLKQEFAGLRTGRASPALLDPVQVEAYGSTMPLNQLATISVPESRMISVQVWDRGMVGAVEKAIRSSNLGLNPITEGQSMRIPIPELNEDRRKELVKVAHKYAEQARIAVRHVRRDGIDVLKRLADSGDVGEDEERRQQDAVQKASDAGTAEIDQMLGHKEKEITQV